MKIRHRAQQLLLTCFCTFFFFPQQEFVSVDHGSILLQLVQRTMDAVRHQDSQNYKRLQKMLIGGKGRVDEDETQEDNEVEHVK